MGGYRQGLLGVALVCAGWAWGFGGKEQEGRVVQQVGSGPVIGGSVPEQLRNRAGLRRGVVESMAAGRWDEAARGLGELLLIDPADVESLLNLGQVRQRQGDLGGAIGFFRDAVRRDPENAAGWMMTGMAEMERGEVLRACASLAMGVALDPKNARAHRWYGMALARRGWNEAAEAELKQSLELDGKDSGAHFNLALLYLNRREPAHALARYHYMTAVDLGGERDEVIEALLDQPREGSKGTTESPDGSRGK